MLSIQVSQDQLTVGKHFHMAFMRTLRIPDDGREYPLPPGLGTFPICRVEDYADRVPASWREHGGVFIPMYQREALWVNFDGHSWHPVAAKLAVGKINAVSGLSWNQRLLKSKQDYVVVPDQPWLDGINAGDGFIKQFVAMPLGMGYTVEGQLTGKEEFGGIQLIVFDAKPGRFPEEPPKMSRYHVDEDMVCYCAAPSGAEMGLGAGGRMRQKIYPDDYGLETWDHENYGRVYIHIVNSMMYREITGKEPPATPVSARTYIDDRALRFEGDWAHTVAAAKRHLGLTDGHLSYEQLLALITDRRHEVDCFEQFLREQTSWLISPASTRFHLAEEGGLVKHSLNVANTLLRLRDTLAPDISVESCVIVALYHDTGKIGMPGQPFYLPNPSEWHVKNRGVHYTVNTDLVHMDIATRSLFLVARHITLTDTEAQAIRYHDGQYIEENHSVAHRETPLTRLLQYADNWSGGVLEN